MCIYLSLCVCVCVCVRAHVQARTLLSSRQSCLRALMQNTTNSENSWVMVDLRDMASPKGSIDSPLINEVEAVT